MIKYFCPNTDGIATYPSEGNPCCNPQPDCNCGCGSGQDPDSLFNPYEYLNDFDDWTLDEKIALFLPMVHLLNLQDKNQTEWNDTVNELILDYKKKKGRDVDYIKQSITEMGVARLLIVFKPFSAPSISNPVIDHVVNWGRSHYLI